MKERLKLCRLQHKYSQKYVALSVGVATPTVSMWESGTKSPSIENLIRLADLYGTTVDYLIGRSDPPGGVVAHRPQLTEYDQELLTYAARLNAQGLEKLMEYARDLTENDRYKKESILSREAE